MRVHIVDPSAYTPPYDHALSAALARAGAKVELVTSRFGYGAVPEPDGYALRELFYRHAPGAPGLRLRLAGKQLEHVPDMLRYRTEARGADVVHFQWLAVQPVDHYLLPDRPIVLTAHDLLPREARPGQGVPHRERPPAGGDYSRTQLWLLDDLPRRRRSAKLGLPRVIP